MHHARIAFCVQSLAGILAASGFASPPVAELLQDVAAIDSGGNPASLIVWDKAEALVVAPDGRIFAAAAEIERGRVVAIGHGGFVNTDRADSEVLAANAVIWLAGPREGDKPMRVFGLSDAVAAELRRREFHVERLNGRPNDVAFDDVDVIIGSPQSFAKAGRLQDLELWIRAGGGMFITETAWGVLQLNSGLTLDTLAANQLLQDVGIRFTGESNSAYGPDGGYPMNHAILSAANADIAMQVLAGERTGDANLAARVVGNAFGSVPLESSFIRNAEQIAESHRDVLDAAYANLANERITPKKNALARALFDLDSRLAMSLPPEQITAHPSNIAFPGPVGPERAGNVTLRIDPAIPGWHSTGLYAPAGEIVTVVVPNEVIAAGGVVQIGAWRDPHQHPYRARMKDALRRFPITSPTTAVASSIGGPIYIDLPEAFAGAAHAGDLNVEIRGAAAAPHYKLGVTDLDAWRNEIRHRDAPWAEMETDDLILTVPSSAIRDVDRPDVVMTHWNAVHEAMQSLEPRTGNHWADRPYRYVADVSVSWGYMYCPSNGPIVIPTSAAAAMFQIDNFDAEGPNNLWGHYHEMGHAHQNSLWTDGATGEVTVNIFTVYALHAVNGYPLDSEVTRTDPATAWQVFDAHRQTGKKFEDVGGPFPRLQMYALLWHAFGFEAFRTAFQSMRDVPASERPRNDIGERNLFLVHFSNAVNRNLAPYFDAWGITVTDASREQLKELPQWMPVAPVMTSSE